MKFQLFAFLMFVITTNLVAIENSANELAKSVNMFTDKTIILEELIDEKNGSLEKAHKSNLEFKYTKDTLHKKFIIYCGKNGIHIKQIFFEFDFENDYYINGVDVFELSSLNPNHLTVYDINSFQASYVRRFQELYFILFDVDKMKNVNNMKENELLFKNFDYNGLTYNLEYDQKTKLPISGEIRRPNGTLSRTLKIHFNKNTINIVTTFYNEYNSLICKINSKLTLVENNKIDAITLPNKLGYREVTDYRFSDVRRYIIVDIPKNREFIAELFKNEDDVARYNIEMSRFSPIKCNHPQHK